VVLNAPPLFVVTVVGAKAPESDDSERLVLVWKYVPDTFSVPPGAT
jgi:hypothetical protein